MRSPARITLLFAIGYATAALGAGLLAGRTLTPWFGAWGATHTLASLFAVQSAQALVFAVAGSFLALWFARRLRREAPEVVLRGHAAFVAGGVAAGVQNQFLLLAASDWAVEALGALSASPAYGWRLGGGFATRQ